MSVARWLGLGLLFLCGAATAAQWKPFCIEGSSCSSPYKGFKGLRALYLDPPAVGPLVTNQGILLHHTPQDDPPRCTGCFKDPHVFRLSASGMEDFGFGFFFVTDANAIQNPGGRTFSFWLGGARAWFAPGDTKETVSWVNQPPPALNNAILTGPPVVIKHVIYIGVSGPAFQSIYMSSDDGNNWTHHTAEILINGDRYRVLGSGRYNFLTNPEKDALWAILSDFPPHQLPGSLWESTDDGITWTQVDNGSFPANTVRVVHDPADQLVSYALTDHGLFISVDRGNFWIRSALTEAIHGLVFIERKAPLSRALIAGTDNGVKLSLDEGKTWADMSKGLLAMPHTVTYGHGQLIATSDAGYFTCNAIDCTGLSQPLPPTEERGLVEVIEFYNTVLDHYFITAYTSEAEAIDQGAAGPGWVRTGERFLAWSVGSDVGAVDVCRFYGSLSPGPNSHFFTLSTGECSFLLNLQETQPADKPRWNFEAYAFSLMPPLPNQQQPCKENFIPVYRAYNNGSRRGIDSNHRYVTDLDLLTPLLAQGWIREGVAFCSPDGTSTE